MSLNLCNVPEVSNDRFAAIIPETSRSVRFVVTIDTCAMRWMLQGNVARFHVGSSCWTDLSALKFAEYLSMVVSCSLVRNMSAVRLSSGTESKCFSITAFVHSAVVRSHTERSHGIRPAKWKNLLSCKSFTRMWKHNSNWKAFANFVCSCDALSSQGNRSLDGVSSYLVFFAKRIGCHSWLSTFAQILWNKLPHRLPAESNEQIAARFNTLLTCGLDFPVKAAKWASEE